MFCFFYSPLSTALWWIMPVRCCLAWDLEKGELQTSSPRPRRGTCSNMAGDLSANAPKIPFWQIAWPFLEGRLKWPSIISGADFRFPYSKAVQFIMANVGVCRICSSMNLVCFFNKSGSYSRGRSFKVLPIRVRLIYDTLLCWTFSRSVSICC